MIFRCVEFAQDAISGIALLQLAGMNSGQPPQVYDWGGGADTVCQLDHEPAVIPDRCFGPTSGANWSDWSLTPSGWQSRSSGATGYAVHDGDIEGWTYTSGFGAPPPSTSFGQICKPATTVAAPSPSRPVQPAAPTAASTTQVAAPSPPVASVTPPPSIVALAPTQTSGARIALAGTGPKRASPTGGPDGAWLLLGGAATVLLGLAGINLRRHRR